MQGARLQLVRRFQAPPERVFAACTEPALLRRWFGPAEFAVAEVEADLRPGGRFFVRMTGPPGSFAAEGVYREIVPPTRLVLTWRWVEGSAEEPPDGVTSLVTFDLAPDGGGTRLLFTHEGLPDQARADNHAQGWSEALAKLAPLIEGI